MGVGLADLYLETIRSLVSAIESKNRFDCRHAASVEKLALAIAARMDLPEAEMEGLRIAAILHDIGKLAVPEHIQLKPAGLDSAEFAKVQCHPVISQEILDGIEFPWPVGRIIRSHHEKWDGAGYPDGLKGEEIPLGARILCVADVYVAMTSPRPHRTLGTSREALDYITSSSERHFDPAVVCAIEGIARDGELPLQNEPDGSQPINAVDHISRAASESVAMLEIAKTASNSLNLDEVLSMIAHKIRGVLPCSLCVIFLRDKNTDMLRARIAVGEHFRYFEDGRARLGIGTTGKTAVQGEGVVIDYDKDDILLPQTWVQHHDSRVGEIFGTAMIVPIVCTEVVYGTINLYHNKRKAYSNEDLRFLKSISMHVGKAVRNALTFEWTRESAMKDPLTGLYNSRYMVMHLEQELSRAQRTSRPVSILGLDLDNFKAVNDTFGHLQGDEVLKEISELLAAQVREYDLVTRYGGDEFVIILPNTGKFEAIQTARRIKASAGQLETRRQAGMEVRIGFSVGVATYPKDGQDICSLISIADQRMYSDKRARKRRAA